MNEKNTERQKTAIRKRRKARRIKRIFVLLCFIISCSAILTVIFKAPFFNITGITIEGEKILTEKQILDKAEITIGKNIFSVRMSKIEDRIKTLAYVNETEVKRAFPSVIKIEVKECVPIAYVAYGKKYALIDSGGKVLELSKKNNKYSGMTIQGLKLKNPAVGQHMENENDERIKNCIDALTILEENKMIEKIKLLDFTKLTGIKINYDDRIFVNCGSFESYDDFQYKLSVCAHLIEDEISPYEKVELDLTMDEAIVRPYIDEETKKKLAEEKRLEEEKKREEEKKTEEEKAEETEND